MPHTVLITGGSGFFGAHLARRLGERGDRVLLYDLTAPQGELAMLLEPVASQVTFMRANILDLGTLVATLRDQRVDQLVHAAAVIDAAYYEHQPMTVFRINVEGTMVALEAARLQGLERFLYVSSLGALPGKRYEPIDEEHPLLDTTGQSATGPYGASKASSELFGLAYVPLGVHFLALRFTTLYGLGMHQPAYIKPFVEGAVRGRPVRLPSGAEMLRNYVYVKDCVDGALLALDAEPRSLIHRIFHVCDEELVTVARVAELVRGIVPGATIEVGPGLSAYEQADIARRGTISITRAREELGYRPRHSLRDGLAEYVQEYRAYVEREAAG